MTRTRKTGGRKLSCAALALLVVSLPLYAQVAGQSLRDALLALNERGAGLVFSSEVVKPDMRVVATPAAGNPLDAAREVLAPHGLMIEHGPAGRWLVTRSLKEPQKAAEAAAKRPTSSGDDPLPIDEVQVVASRYRLYGEDQLAAFDHEEIDRLPHLADDLMRAVGRLPAVTADDFSARINVRGGLREETAVYLDGLELIDPFHLKDLQGALSIVDSNLVERVDLLPAGFPAVYGDYASGVVDIRTLPVPEANIHSVGVSFVNAFANTRGSFNDGEGGYLVSIRRGYLDWLFQLIDTGEGDFTPRYLDFLAKVEHSVGDRHVVSGHVLAAQDDLTYVDDTEDTEVAGEAETLFLWARAASRWSAALTSETVLWRSAVERRRDITVDDADNISAAVSDLRDMEVFGVRSDWQWQPADGWTLTFGGELSDQTVDYDYALAATTNAPEFPGRPPIARRTLTSVEGGTLGIHTGVRRDVGRLSLSLGWRYDEESYTGLDDAVSSPRLNVRYDLSPNTKLLLAWGDYYQFQRSEALQVEDGLEAFGQAMRAEHRVIGVEHRFASDIAFRAEAYQKDYRQLRPRFTNLFDGYEPIPEAEPDRFRVDASSAESHGIELTVKRRAEAGLSWYASYVYSRIDERVDGRDVPREWDQPHAVNAMLNWQGARWNFNVAAAWHSGWPSTAAELGTVSTPGGPQIGIVPAERNAGRFDDYLRVDTRVSRAVNLERGTFTYFFEIYNLFDTENTCCLDEFELLPGPVLHINDENWLPRMPSFGFTWTFY